MKQFPIVQLSPDQIRVDPRNVYRHSDAEQQRLRGVIEEHGNLTTIAVDAESMRIEDGRETFELVGGEARLEAYKSLAVETIPAIMATFETAAQRSAAAIALNGPYGSFDEDALSDMLKELSAGAYDMDLVGLPPFQIDELLGEPPFQGQTDPDDVPEPPAEAITQRGDLILLGEHRLLCGDSTNAADVARLMDGRQADMVYCDPPYGIDLDTDYSAMPAPERMRLGKNITGGREWSQVVGDDEPFDPTPVMSCFKDVSEQFWWGADYYHNHLPAGGSWIVWDKRDTLEKDKMFGSAFELCWSRKKHKRELARVTWAGVWGTEKEPGKKRQHPTHKPVLLAEWFYERYSKPGAVITDLYAGSGTSLLAAERLNRVAYLMEIDPIYCDVIVARYEAFTGKTVQRPARIPAQVGR